MKVIIINEGASLPNLITNLKVAKAEGHHIYM